MRKSKFSAEDLQNIVIMAQTMNAGVIAEHYGVTRTYINALIRKQVISDRVETKAKPQEVVVPADIIAARNIINSLGSQRRILAMKVQTAIDTLKEFDDNVSNLGIILSDEIMS